MKLILNGDAFELTADPPTVTGLIDQLGLTGRPVAVELNEELVRKRNHEATVLSEGDKLEVVTLVGGG